MRWRNALERLLAMSDDEPLTMAVAALAFIAGGVGFIAMTVVAVILVWTLLPFSLLLLPAAGAVWAWVLAGEKDNA